MAISMVAKPDLESRFHKKLGFELKSGFQIQLRFYTGFQTRIKTGLRI
jgi:hypothetical protein